MITGVLGSVGRSSFDDPLLLKSVTLITEFAGSAVVLSRLRVSPTLYVPVVAVGRTPFAIRNKSKRRLSLQSSMTETLNNEEKQL
jgi:hypothetical protein